MVRVLGRYDQPLHTADCHLGQRLAGHDRTEEHTHFLKWLLKMIRDEEIQLLIVAGDVFDSAHPPQATMQLYYDFLRDLSALERCGAVFGGGNHNSPAHLNASSGLLKRFQIHVIGSPSADREEDIIKISPGFDLLDSICVCGVRYLRDRDVLQIVVGDAMGQREERLREGIYQYYEDVRQLAQAHRDRDVPIIATGHLTMNGSAEHDDHQELQSGTLGALQEARFPQDFDYVALGHLHEPHALGGCVSMRYAGSPFPMSFSECDHDKSVVLLDFQAGQLCKYDLLPIPIFRKRHRYGGTLADLSRWALETLPSGTHPLQPWLEVHLTDEATPSLPEKVHELLRDADIEILKVLTQARERPSKVWQSGETSLQEYRPAEVFAERCKAAELDLDEETACRETFEELLGLHKARKLELTGMLILALVARNLLFAWGA
ncbi:MAG: exonuclease SbcD [Verrucomicrobiales bacterium]